MITIRYRLTTIMIITSTEVDMTRSLSITQQEEVSKQRGNLVGLSQWGGNAINSDLHDDDEWMIAMMSSE